MDITGGLLAQTVTIAPFLSLSQNGDRSFGTPVTYPCREENEIRVIKNKQGEDAVNASQLYLSPTYTDASGNVWPTTIGYYDRITLPSGTQPPVILKIDSYTDLDGSVAYIEVDT